MSEAFRMALDAAAGGDSPDTIALMRVLMEAPDPDAARRALRDEAAGCAARGDTVSAARFERLQALWAAHPDAWHTVRAVVGTVSHARRDADPGATLGYLAETFDRLVDTSPEGSVALYSLGSPELLAAATAESVGWMDGLGLLGPDRDALDLGCGIGRFLVALAPRLHTITGLDISARMVAEANRRCSGCNNVALRQSSGRDLNPVADGSLDVVLAVDVFPYLVQASGGLPERHVMEFARVLRPGGTALILNYSYRGDPDADRRDLARLAADAGLTVLENGTSPFTTWDGLCFRLAKPDGGRPASEQTE